jgi:hypothetical protein
MPANTDVGFATNVPKFSLNIDENVLSFRLGDLFNRYSNFQIIPAYKFIITNTRSPEMSMENFLYEKKTTSMHVR